MIGPNYEQAYGLFAISRHPAPRRMFISVPPALNCSSPRYTVRPSLVIILYFISYLATEFVRVMETQESHGILSFHFPSLERHEIEVWVIESAICGYFHISDLRQEVILRLREILNFARGFRFLRVACRSFKQRTLKTFTLR